VAAAGPRPGSEPGRTDADGPAEAPGGRRNREPVKTVAEPGVGGLVLGRLEVGGSPLDLGDEGDASEAARSRRPRVACTIWPRARVAVRALVGTRAVPGRGRCGWLATRPPRRVGRPRWRRGAGGVVRRVVLRRRALGGRSPPGPFAGRLAAANFGDMGGEMPSLRDGGCVGAVVGEVLFKVVADRLGHSAIGTTLDTYSHVVQSLEEHAAAGVASVILGGSALQSGPR
jgi:hypothetical protein